MKLRHEIVQREGGGVSINDAFAGEDFQDIFSGCNEMKYTWLFFVAGAVLTWGAYVVTIDHGRKEIAGNGMPPANAGVGGVLFIGLAYCVAGGVVAGVYSMARQAG